MSETSKHRARVAVYCRGIGFDIGCGEDPINDTAYRIDLPPDEYKKYNGRECSIMVDYNSAVTSLPGSDRSVDYVYSSHLLEDFEDWEPLLTEWTRVIKPGGFLVLLVPEKELFAEHIKKGHPPNMAHKHEPVFGELSRFFIDRPELRIDPVNEFIPDKNDYNLIFIGKKI